MMPQIILLILSLLLVCIVIIVAIQRFLLSRSSQITQKLQEISGFQGSVFKSIAGNLQDIFCNKIIPTSEKSKFQEYYAPYFHEADSLDKKLRKFFLHPTQFLKQFVAEYKDLDRLVEEHNNTVIQDLLTKHKQYFDTCLTYPLDNQQRRAIVSEEDNCLVVSSAGSGKTSSIVVKVKYLTEIKGVSPERILLISYTNKAASELSERIATDGLVGYTFHKLALDIIGKSTGIKPSICSTTDALFVDIYRELLKRRSFKRSVVDCFMNYETDETDQEREEREKKAKLKEAKRSTIKSRVPDMDGKTIYVRSKQEEMICFILASLGVQFRYEEAYEHQLADENHSQYRPDFSIYYTQDRKQKRVYLEHFGIDSKGNVPLWFAQDKNMSYKEANQKYNDGITWKIEAHKKFETELLVTSSADFQLGDIRNKIRSLLEKAGVPIKEKSSDELYSILIQEDSQKEKVFIRLATTFATLLKSSCKSPKEILQQAKQNQDKRNAFVIKHIFLPLLEEYNRTLQEKNQIDFTDAIMQATAICNSSTVVDYDYIIVDEFQDISLDRYYFLKALREGNNPAKLFCVGDDWQSIYRFSGSDMALFNQFSKYFGPTEINKIETTYRFGEPLVGISSEFIQRNQSQVQKNIRPFNNNLRTSIKFHSYDKNYYASLVESIVASIPNNKSIFLLGRFSFDDYYLSLKFGTYKEGNRFYYLIGGRKIEFLTTHKSKGLEADYVILLQCNNDIYGFPSKITDDPSLRYVLTEREVFPFAEERRLFYVAITRAKIQTHILYDFQNPSVFVSELAEMGYR